MLRNVDLLSRRKVLKGRKSNQARSVHHTAGGESMGMFYSAVLCCSPRFLFRDRPRIFSRVLVGASIAAVTYLVQIQQQYRAARPQYNSSSNSTRGGSIDIIHS